jgi:hypothetical protein
MESVSRRTTFKYLLAGAAIGGAAQWPEASAKPTSEPAKSDIIFHGTGFEPMSLHIVAGERINVSSVAASTLKLTSAPDAPAKIQQTVAPHGKASIHFDKPGLYLLYDTETTRFDKKVGQVVAEKSSKYFPMPA